MTSTAGPRTRECPASGTDATEFPIPSLNRNEYAGSVPGANENTGSITALANAPKSPPLAEASATSVTR